MRRPEHTEDRSPVELPWSLIQGGSFLTAFQAAQHITILTLLCSAKEKLWWKHNWETGKSLYVCANVCACTSVCMCACTRRHMHVAFNHIRVCVSSLSATVRVCERLHVCVTTKAGQQWEPKQCQAATLCSLITEWIRYSWVCSYWLGYKGLFFDLYSCWWFSWVIKVSNATDNMSKGNSSSGE